MNMEIHNELWESIIPLWSSIIELWRSIIMRFNRFVPFGTPCCLLPEAMIVTYNATSDDTTI